MRRILFTFPALLALAYLCTAITYILASDHLLGVFLADAEAITRWQTLKGVGFVTVTTLLLYCVLRAEEQRRISVEMKRREEQERVRLLVDQATDLVYRYRLTEPRGFEYVSPASTAMTGYSPEEHYARPELGIELIHEDDRHLLEQALQGIHEGPLTLRWRRRNGAIIWTEQRNRIVRDAAGKAIAIEGIARDITAKKAADLELEQARDLAERTTKRTKSLQSVTEALGLALTPEDVVEVILEHGTRVTGANAAVISRLDPSGEILEILDYTCRPEEEIAKYRLLPIDARTPTTEAVRTGQPVWLATPEAGEALFPGSKELLEHFGDQALATLPLISGDRAIGALSFSYAEAREFGIEERAFLTNLAQQCATTLERTQLFTEASSSRLRLQALSRRVLEAQESERRRIARELHDEVGQVLGALKINLYRLRTSDDSPGSEARLDESLTMLDRLLRQIRALSLDLRPSVLDEQGLGDALEWFAQRVAERSGLAISVSNELDDRFIPAPIASACFRTAQEAINNAVRHAQATQLELRIAITGDLLELCVRDNGIGFDVRTHHAQALSGSSLGLISMSERAELTGGHADISSSEGAGTQIRAWFPLQPPPASVQGA